jgi:hypothetical protein
MQSVLSSEGDLGSRYQPVDLKWTILPRMAARLNLGANLRRRHSRFAAPSLAGLVFLHTDSQSSR